MEEIGHAAHDARHIEQPRHLGGKLLSQLSVNSSSRAFAASSRLNRTRNTYHGFPESHSATNFSIRCLFFSLIKSPPSSRKKAYQKSGREPPPLSVACDTDLLCKAGLHQLDQAVHGSLLVSTVCDDRISC